jgi:hypothetical protein
LRRECLLRRRGWLLLTRGRRGLLTQRERERSLELARVLRLRALLGRLWLLGRRGVLGVAGSPRATVAAVQRRRSAAVGSHAVDDRLGGGVTDLGFAPRAAWLGCAVLFIGSTTMPTASAVDLCTVLGE